MRSPKLPDLRAELLATHHVGRIERMLALGRAAREDPAALALVDDLAAGDVYERRLALTAQHTLRDGRRLLPFTEDQAASLRNLAFTLVPAVCDDNQALEALKVAYTLRRERGLLRALARRRRRPVIDRYLDWLAGQPGLHDFADLVPWCTVDGVRRHLDRALARPSQIFWDRMARSAPGPLGEVLCDRLRAVPGEPDPVTRQLIEKHTRAIAEGAPAVALELVELLVTRRIFSQIQVLVVTGRTCPSETLALLLRRDLRIGGAPFRASAARLAPDELARAVRRDPNLLGGAEPLIDALRDDQRAAVVDAWCDVLREHPTWGFPLLDRIADPARRIQAWERWSVAARGADGVIALARVELLPPDLREREARRHLDEVIALGTRPLDRIVYARYLPWDDAAAAVKAFLGFPEGNVRGVALTTMLAIPGLRPKERDLPDKALALVTARKNEQDPVRGVMLRALVAWPRDVWRPEHAPVIFKILRDALDAGDLSHGTAQAAEALLVRTFRLAPQEAAKWLGTFLKERGNIYDPRLGAHLSDDEVRACAPQLLDIAKIWRKQERSHHVMQLAESLGERLVLVPGYDALLVEHAREVRWEGVSLGLITVLARFARERYLADLSDIVQRWYERGWYDAILGLGKFREKPGGRPPPLPDPLVDALEKVARGKGRPDQISGALVLLRTRALARFDAILPDLLAKDESYVLVPVVMWHLHARRQDLLDERFLGERVIKGRFATGKSAVLLPYRSGFFRWTPPQNATFARSLARIIQDTERDTPTVWSCTAILAALDSAPMDDLAALADDKRPAVQERALRVMARCDRGQCVPTLIRCLDDARARIAIYGLRSALRDMLPRTALHLLGEVPLVKVTVAKEVMRLAGELRSDAAFEFLVALDARDLHRDVRIALLRALWDHLERDKTWDVYARAVAGPDWVMASRLGDIPADRLTAASDRRLSGLLARVLTRPEPEARIDLLQRAAFLAISDPDRAFLTACSERLTSIYDDEVQAAVRALLHRATEHDMQRLPALYGRALADPRCLHVATDTLLSVDILRRASWVGAAEAVERVLAEDPRWHVLRVRCGLAARQGQRLSAYIRDLAQRGLLHGDALALCRGAVGKVHLDQLADFTEALLASPAPAARLVALSALLCDAGPERGWAPERLARLERLQDDPDPAVAGAAHAVFPPREMARKPPPPPKKK